MSKHDNGYGSDLDSLFGGEDSASQYPESPLATTNKPYSGSHLAMPEDTPMTEAPSDPTPMPLAMPDMPMPLPDMPPMPTHMPMPAQVPSNFPPMPMTEVSKASDMKYCQDFQQPQAPQNTSNVPGAAGDWQFKDVPSALGIDPSNLGALFQEFLEQKAMGKLPGAYMNSKAALSTQLQAKANPPPVGAKISHSRNKNGEHRIGQFDWYDKPPVQKGWIANDNGRQVQIKYSKKGEMRQPSTLGRGDIEAYIRGCAERGIPLRLWIQNIPTIHTDRYHHSEHHKCRIRDCAAKGTLGRGAYQVCFDEHPEETSNGRYDPFHVTAYMHLFCLEELIPMAYLMQFADVRADIRDLPLEERNPMSLKRDGSHVIEKVFNDWKTAHHDSYIKTGFPIDSAPRKRDSDCLYYNMTKKKLESQPNTRQRTRDKRNGNDISKHYGNLRKEEANRNKKKRKQARFSSDSTNNEAGNSGNAGNAVNAGNAGNPGNFDSLQGFTFNPMPPPSSKRQRLSGTAQPALQTAAAHAMQSQMSDALPSPLRRSRRLSGALAIDNIFIPPSSAFTDLRTGFTPGFRTGLTPELRSGFTPRLRSGFTPRSSGNGRSSLNIQTDNMSLGLDQINFTPNMDGLVYDFTDADYDQYINEELEKLTGANSGTSATDNNGSGSAKEFGNPAHILHFGQLQTPSGTYNVTTAPVPYGLRATAARRETAIKQTSARISQTEGIQCDEKKLMEAIKSPGLPLKTPTVLPRTSQTIRPVSQQGGANADTTTSPSRRVTRSMSRNGSAVEQPFGQDFQMDMLFSGGLDGFQDGFFDLDSFGV